MRSTKNFDINNREINQRIIIYGAGRYGALAYYGLRALDITPVAFIDDMLAGQKKYEIDVLSSQYLERYKKDIILIASYNYFTEMVEKARYAGCKNIYDIETLLTLDYDESVLDEYMKDEKNNPGKYHRVVENCGNEGIVVNHLEMVVTECCSLKCKDCANLMQYYEHPCNLPFDEMIESFDRFLSTIDLLLELRILGGEPFIVKDLNKIINKYVDNKKIYKVTLYTNGTIIPQGDVLRSLQSDKVSVHMSNYGKVSNKVEDLKKIFEKNRINYYIHEYSEWLDIGYPQKYEYSIEEIKRIYKSCIMAKCYTFYRGKFYVCPRAAHGERLGFFKNDIQEYVDFTCDMDIEESRLKLVHVIEDLEYVNACYYCKGSSNFSNKIPAAIQRKKETVR